MARLAVLLSLLLLTSGCVQTRIVEPLEVRAVEDAPIPVEQIEAGHDRFPYRSASGFGFIDGRGEVAIIAAFDEVGLFSEGLARVRRDGLWGYIQPDGTMAIQRQFLDASDFSGGRARVVLPEARFDRGSREGRAEDRRFSAFITPSGELVTEPVLSAARDFAELNGRRVAIVARSTERRLTPFGMEFLSFLAFSLQTRDGWFILDASGAEVARLDEADRALGFSEGLAAFRERPGFLGTRGRWGYVDPDGNVVIAPRYQNASSFSEGMAAVAQGGSVGYINAGGNWVIEPTFEQGGPFSGGLARIRQQGRWGFVNPAGAVVIAPAYENAADFSEGLAAVGLDGRFGYIQPDGSVALPFVFDLARPFRNGLALVRRDGQEGYITPAGDFVWSRTIE